MKKSYLLMAVAAIAIIFTACEPTSFNETDLYGYWQDNDNADHYKRFLKASEDTIAQVGSYACKYGYDWDGNERDESDLKYHGNGWFKWNLSGSTLTLFEQQDYFVEDEAHYYKVKKLTTNQLQIKKDDITETYTKVFHTPYPFK